MKFGRTTTCIIKQKQQLEVFDQCYFALQGPFVQIQSHTVLLNKTDHFSQ